MLLYAIDELIDDKRLINKKDASKYKGVFSKEEGEKFNEYIKQARNEWNTNA